MSRKRRVTRAFWKVMNPLARPLSGVVPWWVLLETRGRRSGLPRHTPLAHGASFEGAYWIIAVHGEASDFVKNLKADPRVRLKAHGRWRTGTARAEPVTEDRLRRFGAYARGGLKIAIEPCLVRIELDR